MKQGTAVKARKIKNKVQVFYISILGLFSAIINYCPVRVNVPLSKDYGYLAFKETRNCS